MIPPLILLYFLKLRRRPQPIACTLLWKGSVEDLHANAPFQRLRRSLLLFLQLLVLLLLALSIMQPMIQSRSHTGGKTVIIIDNSASMTATDTDDGLTRLDHAKRLARERIESMYSGGLFSRSPGETMIIAFSNRAEPMTQFTDSKPQLLGSIDSIRPTHAVTEIDEALKLARAYTINVVDEAGEARPVGDPPTIVLFSDGRIADLAEQVLRGEEQNKFLFNLLGSDEPDNVGIATISVQRPYDRPDAADGLEVVRRREGGARGGGSAVGDNPVTERRTDAGQEHELAARGCVRVQEQGGVAGGHGRAGPGES